MGYDMKEGTVVRWLVNEGAEVSLGDAIAEIETDKAVVEFESITSGVLRMILVPEGTTVSVGQPIAIIGDADEEITAPSSEGDPAGPEPIEEAPPAPESEESASILLPPPSAEVVEAASTLSPQGMRASPVARQLADERDLDLRLLRGTGPGGRITKNDVLSFEPAADQGPPEPAPVAEEIASTVPAAEPPPVAEEIAPTAPAVEHELEAEPPAAKPPPAQPVEAVSGDIVPLTRMRQQIARVTVRSKREIPHFYVSAQIDMSRAMDLRQQFNDTLKSEGVRVSVNDMIIKACADTLKGFPNLNSFFTDNGIQMNQSINIGVAIAEDAGLIVPAIMDCGNKGMADIARASSDLIDRAKSGTLHPQEYTGGTFSISNLGMFDVTSFVAIIQPPQSAMLAVGTVAEAPVVQDHEIKVSRVMNATISADHRVSDGAEAARFIVEVKRLLENPLSLLV
jgi:pyruvate dehydrogenase E2 component (dihydrolipoamide acetyltransferase)